MLKRVVVLLKKWHSFEMKGAMASAPLGAKSGHGDQPGLDSVDDRGGD